MGVHPECNSAVGQRVGQTAGSDYESTKQEESRVCTVGKNRGIFKAHTNGVLILMSSILRESCAVSGPLGDWVSSKQ